MWLLKYEENSDFSRFSQSYGMNPKQKKQKMKQKRGSRNNSRRILAVGLKMEKVFVLLYFCLIGFFVLWVFFEKESTKLGGQEDGEDLGNILEREKNMIKAYCMSKKFK